MAFTFRKREIKKVGVVGSGQIGPDIALHFSKVMSPHGSTIVVTDVSQEALDKGQSRLHKKVDRGIKSGAFSEQGGAQMKAAVTFTTDCELLRDADLIIEAASENKGIKRAIFSQMEDLCSETTIIASNSSHLEPEVIAEVLKTRERSLVIHYFFPAERNPVVEIVPGAETCPQLVDWLLGFYESIGKVPVLVKSRYGYALDPIFEGMFLAAALCVEEGLGTSREVDYLATQALGQTIGPFTAMNLTGGNPLTHEGLQVYTDKIMPWFHSPEMMKRAVESGEPWDVPGRGDIVEVDEERAQRIIERLQGSYLGLIDEVLSADLISLSDFDMAAELALDMISPIKLAKRLGLERAVELINAVSDQQDGFVRSRFFASALAAGGVEVPVVLRKDREGIAVLTIRRPKTLNAMNQAVFDQLGEHMEGIENDEGIVAAVITGFGVKAFISGADVRFLSAIETPQQGIDTARRSQAVVNKVDELSKPVVAAMNGLAFGGGLELAMACSARVGREGLRVFVGQPEPNLGIIPGAGGTQRLPRLIGLERAAKMLRDGRPISSETALEYGLIEEAVAFDELLTSAMNLARDLATGSASVPEIQRSALEELPESLPEVNIGHLSRAIDGIICRAVLEGARLKLADGLNLEAELFGDVCNTKDMNIGLGNFLKNGPKVRAEFTHE
jgi:enoyl-CoA hydratase / 3-hydroxyacyl-CoA dehydrogenase